MVVIYDLETSGFSDMNDDILQFAYAAFDDNKRFIKSEILYYYHEGMSWSEDAAKVHGLTLEFLRQYKDQFEENVIKMYSILNHNNVIGYNNHQFDDPFCRNWLMRQGISNLTFAASIDLMVAYRPVYKKSRIKLTALADLMGYNPELIKHYCSLYFDTDNSRAHQAQYDVTECILLALHGMGTNLLGFQEQVEQKLTIEPTEDIDMTVTESKKVSTIVRIRLEDESGFDENAKVVDVSINDPKITERGAVLVELPDIFRLDGTVYASEVKCAKIVYDVSSRDLYLDYSGTHVSLLDKDVQTILL